VHIPLLLRRVQGRKMVIAPNALDGELPNATSKLQQAVIQAIVRANSWCKLLEEDGKGSISDLARKLEIDNSYLKRILTLSTLAPEIIEAILNGEEPDGLSLNRLLKPFPESWEEQRVMFGFQNSKTEQQSIES